jgi:hypothetical protein
MKKNNEDKKQKGGFKVVDKRRLSEDEKPPEADEARGTEAAGGEPEDEAAEGANACQGFPEKMDFITFILSMSQTALLNMGCGPHPETGKCDCNLQSAKYTIDILEILQEKTRGNLSGEEERILDRILTELRLMWVQKSRQAKENPQ